MQHVNWTALIIFVALFAFVTWLGFAAAHWRKGDLDLLHEWGLGGRRFGTIVTWFLVGAIKLGGFLIIADHSARPGDGTGPRTAKGRQGPRQAASVRQTVP